MYFNGSEIDNQSTTLGVEQQPLNLSGTWYTGKLRDTLINDLVSVPPHMAIAFFTVFHTLRTGHQIVCPTPLTKLWRGTVRGGSQLP